VDGAGRARTVTTSAPAKVILFGEHGVNREEPALATAVDMRVSCRATARADDGFTYRSVGLRGEEDRESLLAFKAEVDGLRREGALDKLREHTGQDFFAPIRYALAHVVERVGGPGLDAEWRSELPIGSGLGSGAAATASLALAAMRLGGRDPAPEEVASLAWRGDVIAHGGVASGLDSSASSLGGLVRYTLSGGPVPVPRQGPLPLVIGDTLVSANTGEVNTRVRRGLEEHPARARLFSEMGVIVGYALEALKAGDAVALGHLMNLNQLLLEKLGVSSPEIERLTEAALEAGALGAKLSGSGGGGIVVALVREGRQEEVAAAMEAAGGRGIVATAGAPGVRVEPVERGVGVAR